MGVRDHEQPAERDVLADHQPELGDLGILEVRAQLAHEGVVDRPEVGGELLREADRERFPRLEFALRLGPVDLRDRVLIEPLTRRRRVPSEQSGVATVQRRDLEPGQLLDARRNDPFGVTRPEEREEPGEVIRDQGL